LDIKQPKIGQTEHKAAVYWTHSGQHGQKNQNHDAAKRAIFVAGSKTNDVASSGSDEFTRGKARGERHRREDCF
jgi:hypothetical protein